MSGRGKRNADGGSPIFARDTLAAGLAPTDVLSRISLSATDTPLTLEHSHVCVGPTKTNDVMYSLGRGSPLYRG
eukprot:3744176-Amphidinium_carterae.4